jgi:hypothetical protein
MLAIWAPARAAQDFSVVPTSSYALLFQLIAVVPFLLHEKVNIFVSTIPLGVTTRYCI